MSTRTQGGHPSSCESLVKPLLPTGGPFRLVEAALKALGRVGNATGDSQRGERHDDADKLAHAEWRKANRHSPAELSPAEELDMRVRVHGAFQPRDFQILFELSQPKLL